MAERKRKPAAKAPTKKNAPVQWTKEKRDIFFSELSELCNVTAAAKAAGFDDSHSVYRQKAKDADFRARFEEAVGEGYARLELEMLERGRFGEDRPLEAGSSNEKLRQKVKSDPLEASFEALERGSDIGELREEMARLKAQIDAQAVAGARPALSGAKSEGSPFVERYLRKGMEAGVELKAMSGTTDAAGGYAVPEEIDAQIDRTLTAISPIRAIANVVRVGSAGYRKLVTTGGTPSGWVSETADRPETGTPGFIEIAPPFGELYANPAASQAMLDDAAFDVESWLAHEIATEFARAEGAAFVNGSGAGRPKGFLASPNSALGDGARPFGTLQYLATGASGAFPASNPQDKLIDLVQALRPPYRQGAVFVMNSATAARIRKFKTADGAFLWQPGLVAGQPDTLLGYPLVEADDMPDVAADSLSIAFGNFRAGYLIAERAETQILRDPFTHKPFVHFYATKRIGGQVSNSEAIKLMKFSA